VHAHDFGRTHLGALSEQPAKILGKIRHLLNLPLASFVEPVHELARPKGLAPEFKDERFERYAFEAEEIHSFGDGRDHGQSDRHVLLD
jgi:hypothetical protein